MATENLPLSPPAQFERTDAVEVSIVMPCLNEAETLERCIQKASQAIERHGLRRDYCR
jgi:hypothetical protein